MAQRRMIDKRFTRTQRFLRLPLETQALYFHLLQDADDDGIVEAFPILRMIGASEDSLGLLEVKEFVKPLNSEMVYFVIDFSSQNTIRKDRYSPSIYAELLDKSTFEGDVQPIGNQATPNGLPMVASDKIRLDKNRIDKNNTISDKSDDVIPYSEIISYLNEKAGRSFRNTEANKRFIKARWNEDYKLDDFKKVIDNKVADWTGKTINGQPAEKYLQPSTLFGTKFDNYLNQTPTQKQGKVAKDFAIDDRGGW